MRPFGESSCLLQQVAEFICVGLSRSIPFFKKKKKTRKGFSLLSTLFFLPSQDALALNESVTQKEDYVMSMIQKSGLERIWPAV